MDDFDRDVYCLAGLPLDAVTMVSAVAAVRVAAVERRRCFLSTPNLNFLIGSLSDEQFRDSVIHSDLTVADGMPLIWMARALGLPLRERVTGSGMFDALRQRAGGGVFSVYFFGGPDGVAAHAAEVLNSSDSGMRCVGFECPGFGTVEAMSSPETLERINASGADFLVVALGARKGQAWIEHNRASLKVPVISHLGAVVNFVAGTVSRAPRWMQRTGLEWLWRIKEEPALWRRYFADGQALVRLVLTRVLPFALWLRWRAPAPDGEGFSIDVVTTTPATGDRPSPAVFAICGVAPAVPGKQIREALRTIAAGTGSVVIDLNKAGYLSPAVFGLLLMLKKQLDAGGRDLRFRNPSRGMRRLFYWNGVDYLLRYDSIIF